MHAAHFEAVTSCKLLDTHVVLYSPYPQESVTHHFHTSGELLYNKIGEYDGQIIKHFICYSLNRIQSRTYVSAE